MDKEKLASFGIGIGTGLLIGGILGILYAPKKGSETRAIVRDKAGKFAAKVKDIPAKVRAFRGKGTIDDVKGR
jgi:gas vesicle protein